ncbi:MAG: CsbD family protein [Acidimicrobiales bacterium]
MKDSDLDQAKGRIKQAAGDLAGDDQLKREGKADEFAGKAKDGLDKAADKLRDVVDSAKEKLQDRR